MGPILCQIRNILQNEEDFAPALDTRSRKGVPMVWYLDLINTRPRILLQMASTHGSATGFLNLTKYVEHHEECIQEAVDYLDVARAAVKNLYVRLLFAGTYGAWKKCYNVKKTHHRPSRTSKTRLKKDIRLLRKQNTSTVIIARNLGRRNSR